MPWAVRAALPWAALRVDRRRCGPFGLSSRAAAIGPLAVARRCGAIGRRTGGRKHVCKPRVGQTGGMRRRVWLKTHGLDATEVGGKRRLIASSRPRPSPRRPGALLARASRPALAPARLGRHPRTCWPWTGGQPPAVRRPPPALPAPRDCAHTDTMASKALIGSSGASVGRSGEDTAPVPAKGLNPIPGWTGWQAQGSLPQLPAAWRPQVPPRQLGAYPPALVTPGIGDTGNGRHWHPAATDKAPIGSTTAPVERTMASGAELAPKVVPTTVPPGGGAAAPGGHQSGAPGSCLAPRPRPNPIATSLAPVALRAAAQRRRANVEHGPQARRAGNRRVPVALRAAVQRQRANVEPRGRAASSARRAGSHRAPVALRAATQRRSTSGEPRVTGRSKRAPRRKPPEARGLARRRAAATHGQRPAGNAGLQACRAGSRRAPVALRAAVQRERTHEEPRVMRRSRCGTRGEPPGARGLRQRANVERG